MLALLHLVGVSDSTVCFFLSIYHHLLSCLCIIRSILYIIIIIHHATIVYFEGFILAK